LKYVELDLNNHKTRLDSIESTTKKIETTVVQYNSIINKTQKRLNNVEIQTKQIEGIFGQCNDILTTTQHRLSTLESALSNQPSNVQINPLSSTGISELRKEYDEKLHSLQQISKSSNNIVLKMNLQLKTLQNDVDQIKKKIGN
jgi:predicted  nucleic acid-binding Zn-ribbon protein